MVEQVKVRLVGGWEEEKGDNIGGGFLVEGKRKECGEGETGEMGCPLQVRVGSPLCNWACLVNRHHATGP